MKLFKKISDNFRKGKFTLTSTAVGAVQVVSLLPLPFILASTGYYALYAHETGYSVLFKIGMASISRVELWLVSLLYRFTLSETALFFGVLLTALAFGLIYKRVASSSEKASLTFSRVFACWLIFDMLFRLLPLTCNGNFGIGYELAGLAVRAGITALVTTDLIIRRKKRLESTEKASDQASGAAE